MPQALIWGASGGIGSALTDLLIQEGWRVYGVARQSDRIAEGVMQAYEFEASDSQSFESVVRLVSMETESLDLMVYAVGGVAYQKLGDMTTEDWQNTLDSNLNGALFAAQQCMPLMSKNGHIVFIGAYLDHIQLPKMGAYATAKGALEQFAIVLAKENRRKRITMVRPGAVNTAFWEQVGFKKPDTAKPPQDVAKAILQHHQNGETGDINLD
jgi:NAD(P)-dependent dehydrogenase (short-subunit alcohol dehydrogenase family)